MTPQPPQLRRYLRLDKHDLVYLKFVLEAHEGLTTLSTVARKDTVVSVTFGADVCAEVKDLLHALAQEVRFVEVTPEGEGFREMAETVAGGGASDAR